MKAATRSAAIGDTPLAASADELLVALAPELLGALVLEVLPDVELFEELWPPELLQAAVSTVTTAAVKTRERNPLLDIESPTLQ